MLSKLQKTMRQFGVAQRSARAPSVAMFMRPSIEDRIVAFFRSTN